MKEAVSTSETSVNFHQTEDGYLRTHRRENLKSYFHQTTHRNIPEDSQLGIGDFYGKLNCQ
jgi:hypothetical protein